MANKDFAEQLLRLRGRTGLTQRSLAARLNTHVRSVQLWEAGLSHPSNARLQELIEAVLETCGFADGDERTEAEALWTAVMAESPRQKEPFDAVWFTERLRERPRAATLDRHTRTLSPTGQGRQYWGTAPDATGFLGRDDERRLLHRWTISDRCRLVALLGLGGVGKTLLAARLAYDVAPAFERVYWRSLRDALPFHDWLRGAMDFLSPDDVARTNGSASRLDGVLELLQDSPTLLILDNFDSVLVPGERDGGYLPDCVGYGELLRRLVETAHQSCLLLTSREEPPELEPLTGAGSSARVHSLGGLSVEDGRAMLERKGLVADASAWDTLIPRYGGNPLVLGMIGASIQELFGGDVAAYLDDIEAAQGGVFGSVRELLDDHVQRLPTLEHELLLWLTVEREPVTFAELALDLGASVSRGDAREAVQALLHRSLLERQEPGPKFLLPSVVLDYMTEQLVEDVTHGIARRDSSNLVRQPLARATAKDYVRRNQERVLAAPVVDRLVVRVGSRPAAERRLLDLLDDLRHRPAQEHGYGPGNIVNLLRLLRGDLRSIDLSSLAIRQAYLAGVEAQDATLAGSSLAECAMPQSFHHTRVALSTNGTHILAGTSTGELCLWRATDRLLLLAEAAHAGPVIGVALCGPQMVVATAGHDGLVKLWDASSGRSVAILEGHTDAVHSVALSADGELVASASQDQTVRLWRASGGEPLRTLASVGDPVLSLTIVPDKSLVIGGSQSGTITIWNTLDGAHAGTLLGHAAAVSGLAAIGGGRLIASASHDGTVNVWDVRERALRATLTGHTRAVLAVAASRDGELIASGSQDGTVHLWSGQHGTPLATLAGHGFGICDLSISDDGQYVAGACEDGSVLLWETSSGHLVTTLEGRASAICGLALSGDGRFVATGVLDGTVAVWTTTNNAARATLRADAGLVGVALSDNGDVAATASRDGTVKLWRLDAGPGTPAERPIVTLRGPARDASAVAVDGAFQVIVSGDSAGTVSVWTTEGQVLRTLKAHAGSVLSLAVDGSGRFMASSGVDGTVKLWDLNTGTCLRTLAGHLGGGVGVALSRDGRLLAWCGFDQVVRVWDVASARLLTAVQGHDRAIGAVALTGDGSLVAIGGFDGVVKLWDIASGACLHTLRNDRAFERMDITDLSGVTPTNRAALVNLGAVERDAQPAAGTPTLTRR